MAVNARTVHHLKRAAKTVLVNGGCAFEPEVNVNVKARAVVKRNRRIAESARRVALIGQNRLRERPFDDFPRRKFLRQIRRLQCFSGECGKHGFVVIFIAPELFDFRAERLEQFHN